MIILEIFVGFLIAIGLVWFARYWVSRPSFVWRNAHVFRVPAADAATAASKHGFVDKQPVTELSKAELNWVHSAAADHAVDQYQYPLQFIVGKVFGESSPNLSDGSVFLAAHSVGAEEFESLVESGALRKDVSIVLISSERKVTYKLRCFDHFDEKKGEIVTIKIVNGKSEFSRHPMTDYRGRVVSHTKPH